MEAGTLSGRYETGERLGSGGMSNVYKATDRILERTVAVKILAEHLSDDDRFVARFRREALAVARLIHPNIVQVYDSGVDDGRHYIVMEYVAGRSGAQLLQRHGPVDPEIAAEIGIQACAGLDYAHRRGIIHRDVKPGNLMITGGPVGSGDTVVKLTDFGIARAIEQTRITQVGSVVGTAAYLSPEQVRGDEATPGPTSTRSASSSTSSSPAGCPTRAPRWPSWRCASRTRSRCPRAPTTPRCRRR